MKNWLKENFTIIKIHLVLLVGIGLFTYNLFNFSSEIVEGYNGCSSYGLLKFNFGLPGLPECPSPFTFPVTTYYYYDNTTLILLAVGAILIVIGLLEIRKRNSE